MRLRIGVVDCIDAEWPLELDSLHFPAARQLHQPETRYALQSVARLSWHFVLPQNGMISSSLRANAICKTLWRAKVCSVLSQNHGWGDMDSLLNREYIYYNKIIHWKTQDSAPATRLAKLL